MKTKIDPALLDKSRIEFLKLMEQLTSTKTEEQRQKIAGQAIEYYNFVYFGYINLSK